MDLQIDPSALKARNPENPGALRLWEKKNFNLHRGVIEWNCKPSQTIEEIGTEIRRYAKIEFRPAWFRGFGFGTILHMETMPPDLPDFARVVDTRNRYAGVWQWNVLCLDRQKVAIGIHTWLHGYLRPTYDNLLEQLRQNGFTCESTDAEVDKLFVVLNTIQSAMKIGRGILG